MQQVKAMLISDITKFKENTMSIGASGNELYICDFNTAIKSPFFIAKPKRGTCLDKGLNAKWDDKVYADMMNAVPEDLEDGDDVPMSYMNKSVQGIATTINDIQYHLYDYKQFEKHIRSAMFGGHEFNPDDFFEFAVAYVVNEGMIQRIFEINAEIDRLNAEKEKIKSYIIHDAEMTNDGTLFNSYELQTSDGIVSVSNKYTVDMVRPGLLKNLLKDEKDDLISESVVYKPSAALNKVLLDIHRGLVGAYGSLKYLTIIWENQGSDYKRDSKSTKDIDVTVFTKQMRSALKKDYRKNIHTFMNLLGVTQSQAEELAVSYYMAEAHDEFEKIARIAGIDMNDSAAVKDFKASLMNTYSVNESSSFAIKALN